MSKYLSNIVALTHPQRREALNSATLPGTYASALVSAPLLIVGGLLLASGLVEQGVVESAIGILCLAGAVTLLTPGKQ